MKQAKTMALLNHLVNVSVIEREKTLENTATGLFHLNDERSKMIINPTDEVALQAKQEQKNEGRIRPEAVPSGSRQWSSLRNPRIVRVSRSFGGKDRHSKVFTIRGLRDRRIRLSVPTAVQLYDLQDKLGLSQPSKVIDWLLDATKEDIDKLPPLQMPQGLGQFHRQTFIEPNGSRNPADLLSPHESGTSQFLLSPVFPMSTSTFPSKRGIDINDSIDGEGHETTGTKSSKYWNIDLELKAKEKVLQREPLDDQKGKSIEMNELQKEVGTGVQYTQLSAQKFFPRVSYSSLPLALTNNTMPYSYNQLEHSNLSLSQFGAFQPLTENFLHSSSVSLRSSSSSSSALPSGSQLYLCPPVMPSLFPAYPPYVAASTENNPRQINHCQLPSLCSSPPILPTASIPPLHLINQPVKLSQSNTNAEFLQAQDDTQTEDHEQSN